MDTVKQKPGHSDTEKYYKIAQARTWTTFFKKIFYNLNILQG